MVQRKDNCEKSEFTKNLNEKVLFIGNQEENFCADTDCLENRVSLVVPTVNHTKQDQILNQSYCTSTTNITKKNIVQTTTPTTFSKKQRTIGLDPLIKIINTEEIPKREISGTMEYDLVEELNKPLQEDFNDIDFSAYTILQDLIDDNSPSVDDCSGEASPTPATAETTTTASILLTPDIELKQEISPVAATNLQMEDLFLDWNEDQFYGNETVTQPDPADGDFLSFPNDLNNEDTINLNDTCLQESTTVLKSDPLLCDSPNQIKPIKTEYIHEDTAQSQESFCNIFLTPEIMAQDSNNNTNNNEEKQNITELVLGGVILTEEPSFNIPQTIVHDTNNNSNTDNRQRARFGERKRKLNLELTGAGDVSKPKKLFLPKYRIVAADEAYPSTPEVLDNYLDLTEQFPTNFNNSNNAQGIDFDDLLQNQNEVSNGPSEDLSSNSSTAFTAPSTPFSYPSTSTTPTPTTQKRRGRPPKTDSSLPNPEEMEHLTEKERKYYELRGKNNMASRKSRQRRKYKEEMSKHELEELKHQNSLLTSEYSRLEGIESQLKSKLQSILSKRSH